MTVELHNIPAFQRFFGQPYIGTVETGMVEGWRLVEALVPDIRVVVIRRRLQDVKDSLAKFGLSADEDLARRDKLLDEVEADGALSITYDELDTMEGCKKIFEYCLNIPFDHKWWLGLQGANIQIDMDARIKRLTMNRAGIENLKREVGALCSN
ncbi:MAG: hypothetical protein WC100_01630 [Sterolibacterium sp.]